MYTQTDLDRLERAIAAGALTIQTETDTTTFPSFEALLAARNHIKSELAAAAGTKSLQPRYQVAVFE